VPLTCKYVKPCNSSYVTACADCVCVKYVCIILKKRKREEGSVSVSFITKPLLGGLGRVLFFTRQRPLCSSML